MSNISQQRKAGTLVGVISDTHGLLRPQAIDALAASDLIVHAGDIGKPEVLEGLKAIAPVIAVRGNNDKAAWAAAIPQQESVKVEEISLQIIHIVKELNFDFEAGGVRVVISGHSHKPMIEERAGLLFVNPGSAGLGRFKLPISVARLYIDGKDVRAKIVELAV